MIAPFVPPLYIGPGIGVGTIIIILLVLGLVVFSFGVILWIPLKRAGRRLAGQGDGPRQPLAARLVRLFALSAVSLAVITVFSWFVRDAVGKGHKLGALSDALRTMAEFPDKVGEVLTSNALRNIPDSYLELRPGFTPVNHLQRDLYGINGFWNEERDAWDIHVLNYRNDSILHTWSIPREVEGYEWQLETAERLFENAPPMHSLMLPDRSVVAKLNKTQNLIRLDASSKVLWVNHDLIWHHCIHPSIDGHIWTCGSDVPYEVGKPSVGRRVINLNGQKVPYQEDHVVKVDVNTGRILFRKGVAAILVENGLAGRLYGGSLEDPIHLNDITPVTADGPHWKRGDLFLSVRGRSMILLYRPEEDRVVRVIDGPLILEHDVNVLDEHHIDIFNNRSINSHQYPEDPEVFPPRGVVLPTDSLNHSQVLVYDLRDSSFTALYNDLFRSEDIQTLTQGLSELLPDSLLFVESQNQGIYWVLGPQGVVMRKAYSTPMEGRVHGPNWTQLLPARPWPPAEDMRTGPRILPSVKRAAAEHAAAGPPVPPPTPLRTFLVVLAASVLLAIGIMGLKRPFIRLSERTARLVDTLLDRRSEEQVRHRALIRSATAEVKSLVLLLVLLFGVLLLAAAPLWVAGGFSGAGLAAFPLMSGWGLLAMLVGTTVPFVVAARLGPKADYSEWSKLLHRIVLDNYHIGRFLFDLERRKLGAERGVVPTRGPVIVSGLARAGTTALTTMLARSPAFHSLSYANMPFLLAPRLWRRFYRPKEGNARERSHGDKVLFSLTSVEALEEYFFKVILDDRYILPDSLVEHELDAEAIGLYADYQRVLRPDDRPASLYLAKNNNLILRFRSLRERMPGLRAVLLFRDPLDHAYSLLKQHVRQSAQQEKDPFVLEYMNWLGHHEFGKGLKHFAFDGGGPVPSGDPAHIDHWLTVWIAYYTRLLALVEGEDVLLVDYADLVRDPRGVVERVERYVGTPFGIEGFEPFENPSGYTGERDEELVRQAMAVHARLRARMGRG